MTGSVGRFELNLDLKPGKGLSGWLAYSLFCPFPGQKCPLSVPQPLNLLSVGTGGGVGPCAMLVKGCDASEPAWGRLRGSWAARAAAQTLWSGGGALQSGVSQPALPQEEPLHLLRAQVGPVRMLLLAQPWQAEEEGQEGRVPSRSSLGTLHDHALVT